MKRQTKPEGRKPEDLLAGPTGKELVDLWLRSVRAALYPETLPDDQDYRLREPWFRDKKLLQQAVTWPAAEMKRRGWFIGGDAFTAMIKTVLLKVKLHGPAELHAPARYFYKSLQDEFNHNWDKYYDEAKRHAQDVDAAIADLMRRGQPRPVSQPVMDVLAAAHEIVARPAKPGPRKKPAKAAPRETQEELF